MSSCRQTRFSSHPDNETLLWLVLRRNHPLWRHTLSSSMVTFDLAFNCVFFFVNVPVFINWMLCAANKGWFSGIWFAVNVLMFPLPTFGGGGALGSVPTLFCGKSANSGGGSWWWECVWWWAKIVAGSFFKLVWKFSAVSISPHMLFGIWPFSERFLVTWDPFAWSCPFSLVLSLW